MKVPKRNISPLYRLVAEVEEVDAPFLFSPKIQANSYRR